MSGPEGFVESPWLFTTYRRQPVTFVRGEGSRLWDDRGREYLDFFSGLAVCNLGHAHPAVVRAVTDQAARLWHTSNLYITEPQRQLAQALSQRTFGGRVFFTNSGAEANEGAIKLARRFGHARPGPQGERHEIIVFERGFHGRTLGALSATPQKKYREGFGPLLDGFPVAVFGDMESVAQRAGPRACAVLVEPIQGEGGVRTAPPSFFQQLAEFCRSRDLLLMFDEVQTGLGRTGALYAYQNEALAPPGVVPDVLTTAKGLANGLPMGALLARAEVADLLHPGDHATTFGGGPLPSRAALAVLEELTPERLAHARRLGGQMMDAIGSWRSELPAIVDVRGAGLMIGVELDRPALSLVDRARERGLLINVTAERVVRLLPPLVLTEDEARRGLAILKDVLQNVS